MVMHYVDEAVAKLVVCSIQTKAVRDKFPNVDDANFVSLRLVGLSFSYTLSHFIRGVRIVALLEPKDMWRAQIYFGCKVRGRCSQRNTLHQMQILHPKIAECTKTNFMLALLKRWNKQLCCCTKFFDGVATHCAKY